MLLYLPTGYYERLYKKMYKRPPIMSALRPVTPEEAAAKYQAKMKPIIERVIEKVNIAAINSNGIAFTYYPEGEQYQLYNMIKQMFELSGWNVSQDSDQRDGTSWWSFKAKPKVTHQTTYPTEFGPGTWER
jgi:hypothetical protein